METYTTRLEKSGTLQVTSRSQALAKVRQEIGNYIPAIC
jgi:hypothetical protein